MGSSFHEYLTEKAREQPTEAPELEPPIECPRCSALILETAYARHADWHERLESWIRDILKN